MNNDMETIIDSRTGKKKTNKGNYGYDTYNAQKTIEYSDVAVAQRVADNLDLYPEDVTMIIKELSEVVYDLLLETDEDTDVVVRPFVGLIYRGRMRKPTLYRHPKTGKMTISERSIVLYVSKTDWTKKKMVQKFRALREYADKWDDKKLIEQLTNDIFHDTEEEENV